VRALRLSASSTPHHLPRPVVLRPVGSSAPARLAGRVLPVPVLLAASPVVRPAAAARA